ncbi:thymidylate kinase [Arthrobacter mobilis]|uniref:Thymidylate kinase n=1 Tax=Arthrobacter mobilis TaxID=2724944 RepID=A0A7X6HBE4_9MICC|nr:thymidylate kinase [Arthrobacter mobilis]NKX53989.1 thymidylate kinase [Arthrobacter mobilis]
MPGHRAQENFRVALAGIDGAGKSTAAADLRGRLESCGTPAVVYGVFGGRKTLDSWARRFGTSAVRILGTRGLDLVETLVRTVAMVRMCLARQGPDTLVVMDRSFYCQLALRQSRGLRGGGLAGWLLGLFPKPHLVVYFAISPEQALRRIRVRDTDAESLEALRALDAGYRALEDFGSFEVIDAGRSRTEVLDQLERVIQRPEGQMCRRP